MDRASLINAIMGMPYDLGGRMDGAVDCYGCARLIQSRVFGREMPEFSMPADAGRIAIASAIAVHPERARWAEVDLPSDGALVTMARNDCGYHIGTWLDDDGGIIVHAMEGVGVVADTIQSLKAVGWRRFRFHTPT